MIRSIIHIRHLVMGVGLVVAVVGCLSGCARYKPRYTPATVALPLSAPTAVEAVAPIEERAAPVTAEGASQTLSLSRDGAILTALRNNLSIEVAGFNPEISRTFISEARAAFDPALTAAYATGYDKRPAFEQAAVERAQTGGSAEPATPLETTIEGLRQIQKIAAILDPPGPEALRTDLSEGSAAIETLTLLGTQLSLSARGSDTDTEGIGDLYDGAWTFGVDQPLLRGAGPAVNLVALRQAKNRQAQSEFGFRSSVLETVTQTELAYWDLVLDYEVLKIRQFAVTLADEQLKRNETLLEVGKVIEGDVASARAEKASRQADLADAEAAIRRRTLSLIRLLNPDTTDPWQLTFETLDGPDVVETTLDAETSAELALVYRPDLAQAKLDIANADLTLLQARNGRLPRLDLVSSYGRTSTGMNKSGLTRYLNEDDFDNFEVGVRLQTSLTNRAERARYRRAKLVVEQSEVSLTGLEQQVDAQVRQAIVEAQRQWERINATREEVASRTEELRVVEGRNAVGMTTNLDLLIVQRNFIQAQLDDITARVRYIQALTALYSTEGTLLERRGVYIDKDNA